MTESTAAVSTTMLGTRNKNKTVSCVKCHRLEKCEKYENREWMTLFFWGSWKNLYGVSNIMTRSAEKNVFTRRTGRCEHYSQRAQNTQKIEIQSQKILLD